MALQEQPDSSADVDTLTVPALKDKLRSRGLQTTGKKAMIHGPRKPAH